MVSNLPRFDSCNWKVQIGCVNDPGRRLSDRKDTWQIKGQYTNLTLEKKKEIESEKTSCVYDHEVNRNHSLCFWWRNVNSISVWKKDTSATIKSPKTETSTSLSWIDWFLVHIWMTRPVSTRYVVTRKGDCYNRLQSPDVRKMEQWYLNSLCRSPSVLISLWSLTPNIEIDSMNPF